MNLVTLPTRLFVLPRYRLPWLLLAATALGLELTALYFQYVLELDPCVLCVYERTGVAGIFAAGLLGAIVPRLRLFRWSGLVLWGVSAGWGLSIAMQHVGIQLGKIDLTCSYLPDFPAWAPLEQWWPEVFMPTGLCGDVQWVFAGLSMPQWMVVIFSLYLLVLAAVVAAGLVDVLRARKGATRN
jgi:disulfide bond formation protein DsbB